MCFAKGRLTGLERSAGGFLFAIERGSGPHDAMALDSLIVPTKHGRYPIHVGAGLAADLRLEVDRLRREARPVAIFVDAQVAQLQAGFLKTAFGDLPRQEIPSGEPSKCFAELERSCDFLAAHHIDRSGAIFAVGGGVAGDLAGFAAASYLRGVDFYQVPTTLLAMVDSSVGGKTGLNLRAGKNLVGAFHQPKAVFADVDLLRTLPGREFSAGMAEVIKHGLLADRALFEDLEQRAEPLSPGHPAMAAIVRANCAIKAGVVASDEEEKAATGGRALLNLGHTFGHAIEAVAGYGQYLHGEAIAIGLVCAARLSEELRMITGRDVERVRSLVLRYGLPAEFREPLPLGELMAAMNRDKKVNRGRLKFVVLAELGRAQTTADVPAELVERLWCEVGAKD